MKLQHSWYSTSDSDCLLFVPMPGIEAVHSLADLQTHLQTNHGKYTAPFFTKYSLLNSVCANSTASHGYQMFLGALKLSNYH